MGGGGDRLPPPVRSGGHWSCVATCRLKCGCCNRVRFRCILVTTETVPRGHSARRGAGSQAATRSLPTLRPSRHPALRVPWRHSLLVSAPYVPGSEQRSSAQGLPWLWRSCVFLSSDWLLGLVGDRFDPSDPRTHAGSAGTPPETRPWPRRPPSLFLHSQTWPSASAGTC